MAKPSPDFGEFKYDKQGVCTNPKTLLEHESDTLTYKLLISQCRMGFCIGYLFDQEGTTPVGQSVSIHNTVYRLEEEAIKDLCTQAHEFFKGNMKRIPALEELNKFIFSNGLKDLMKGERKGTPIMHVVPAAKKEQPDAGTSIEEIPYMIIFAEIKDDFCNYHYRITTGKHKDFVHKVTNKIGIIDDDLREALELIIKKLSCIGDLVTEDIIMIARKGLATGNAENDFEYWPDSSTIYWAEYHPKRQALYIMFRTRKLYHYDDFPSDEWQKMKRSESVGKFFNTTVKQYPSREVEAS